MAQQFTPEFKNEIIRLVQTGTTVAKVCSDYSLSSKTVYAWLRQAKTSDTTPFVGSGKQTDELKEQRKEAKRIRDLEEQVEILKKAMLIRL